MTAAPANGNPAPLPPPVPVKFPKNEPENEPEYIPNPVVDPPDRTSTRALESARDAEVVLLELTAQLDVPKNPTPFCMELVYDEADTFPSI